jgi:hypothetical protein
LIHFAPPERRFSGSHRYKHLVPPGPKPLTTDKLVARTLETGHKYFEGVIPSRLEFPSMPRLVLALIRFRLRVALFGVFKNEK